MRRSPGRPSREEAREPAFDESDRKKSEGKSGGNSPGTTPEKSVRKGAVKTPDTDAGKGEDKSPGIFPVTTVATISDTNEEKTPGIGEETLEGNTPGTGEVTLEEKSPVTNEATSEGKTPGINEGSTSGISEDKNPGTSEMKSQGKRVENFLLLQSITLDHLVFERKSTNIRVLFELWKLAEPNNYTSTDKFTLESFAKKHRVSKPTTKKALATLSNRGFIRCNREASKLHLHGWVVYDFNPEFIKFMATDTGRSLIK
ncbi:MAG: hypothetical protein EOP48_07590 [Sphingobacteriales bacterium]|nr:MAG: hypothetical protein EOP48_07590 [Sphingobacteriales bacterium]